MRVLFKITENLRQETLFALGEPHSFAAERVAFLRCRIISTADCVLVLAVDLHRVADEDYLDYPSAGATMGPAAIRKALQTAYVAKTAMFHVHLHAHIGRPGFSRIDYRESALFIPDFWNVQPSLPHGAIVLSKDSAWGRCWYPGLIKPIDMDDFAFVGIPMRCTWKQ